MTPSKQKHLKPGEKVALSLSLSQVELIVEKTLIEEELLAIFYAARVWDGVVIVRCTLGHLGRFARHIKAEVTSTKDSVLQKQLVVILGEISKLEQRYCPKSPPHLSLIHV
jgi:hypothetical protein